MDNKIKYELATSFDEERRIQHIQKFVSSNATKWKKNPTALVKVSASNHSDRWIWTGLALVFFFLWLIR
jgi:dihydroorotase